MATDHKPAHVIPARDRVIVALDVPDLSQLEAFLDRLDGRPTFYKVGLELFIAEGERAVEMVQQRNGRLFLDLKLHDIPETVARAVTSAARINAELMTVHTSGGFAMLQRAAEAAGTRVKILGVTVLTSLLEDDLRAEGIEATIPEMVRARARVASRAGIAGLVCSPHEIEHARQAAPGLFIVVPGIRPGEGAGAAPGDQKRVATATQAISAGADYIVVGRPIRDARDAAGAFDALVAEVEAAV
ncbi:MAG TPA: orotidine-5'-phosphate decarboxylase [Polyangia bacterium]|jgi:orotidine-5'-phosphate decarboxylase|nr:orotidine-5'-phosphate decarboxylase [Polyangia bacterium]